MRSADHRCGSPPVDAYERIRGDVSMFSVGRFEELRDLAQRLYYPHQWHAPPDVHRLPVEYTAMTLGGITISAVSIRGEVSASSVERGGYFVALAENGRVDTEHRGVRIRVSRETATIHQPSGSGWVSWNGADTQPIGVKIDSAVLESALQAQLGLPVRRPLDPAVGMNTAAGPGRSWAHLIRLLHEDAVSGPTLLDNPLIRSRLHDAVVLGLLTAADHPYRQQLLTPVESWRPRTVQRAIDIMEAHPERPVCVTALASTVGVSPRALQDGFRQHVGVTPMGYLRQVRLRRARHDLHHADGQGETVADVAYRWGFGHLGRFAAAYRQAFGESPSQTLRG